MLQKKGELRKAEDFILKEFDRLIEWSIGDIKKCCRLNTNGTCEANGSLAGSFILWCCAIDYFGGIYTGCTKQGETTRRFKEFVKRYMGKYDYKKLLELRWALLHFYSSRHFAFHQSNDINTNKQIHLTVSNNGIVLDLSYAIKDLENAVNLYKNDLLKSDDFKIRLYRYYEVSSPLMPINIERGKSPKMHSLPGAIGFSESTAGTAIF